LPGNEALIHREGEALIIVPKHPKSLLATLKKLEPITEQFPPIDELAIESVDL